MERVAERRTGAAEPWMEAVAARAGGEQAPRGKRPGAAAARAGRVPGAGVMEAGGYAGQAAALAPMEAFGRSVALPGGRPLPVGPSDLVDTRPGALAAAAVGNAERAFGLAAEALAGRIAAATAGRRAVLDVVVGMALGRVEDAVAAASTARGFGKRGAKDLKGALSAAADAVPLPGGPAEAVSAMRAAAHGAFADVHLLLASLSDEALMRVAEAYQREATGAAYAAQLERALLELERDVLPVGVGQYAGSAVGIQTLSARVRGTDRVALVQRVTAAGRLDGTERWRFLRWVPVGRTEPLADEAGRALGAFAELDPGQLEGYVAPERRFPLRHPER